MLSTEPGTQHADAVVMAISRGGDNDDKVYLRVSKNPILISYLSNLNDSVLSSRRTPQLYKAK